MLALKAHYLSHLLRSLLLLIPFAASVQAQVSLPRVALSHPVFAYAEATGTVNLEVNPHVLGGVELSHSADGGFYAWEELWGRPESAHPVCRFYSKLVNSHFYTADPGECELLSGGDQGWLFEGHAMWTILPTAGACPAGTLPVWRLYNDRYAELDSNHRFVADSEQYRSMISSGWVGEGVAFCSPQPGG